MKKGADKGLSGWMPRLWGRRAFQYALVLVGCVIIVDPGHAPRDGSYVIVEYAGDVFFRQLVVDGERWILKPLNPKYGSFELTPPYTIRGGVVQRVGRRRAERRHYE